MTPFLAPLSAFTATLLVNWWLAGSRLATLTLDHPNRRSLHGSPIPRVGGIGLHAGVLLAACIIQPDLPRSLWPALALLHRGLAAERRARDRGALAARRAPRRGRPVRGRRARRARTRGGRARRARHRLDGQPLQLHGRLGRPRRRHGAHRILVLRRGRRGRGEHALRAAQLQHRGRRRGLSRRSTSTRRASSWATPARCRWASWRRRWASLGWLRDDWTWWFPLLVFSPFIVDASVTLARRHLRAGEGLARAPRPLLPAPGAARLGASQDRARRVRADARLRRDGARGARGAGSGPGAAARRRLRRLSRADRGRGTRLAPAAARRGGTRSRAMRINWRGTAAFAHDVVACAAAWLAAFWLRFNLEIPGAVPRATPSRRSPRWSRCTSPRSGASASTAASGASRACPTCAASCRRSAWPRSRCRPPSSCCDCPCRGRC